MSKRIQIKTKSKKQKYPSAKLVKDTCSDDYKRLLDTYDKIYEKVNIALVLCGVLMTVVVPTFDYTVFIKLMNTNNALEIFSLITYLSVSFCSVLCMVWAVVQLLILMRSKQIITVDTIAMRDDKIYDDEPEEANLWLIDKFTKVIQNLKQVIQDKQQRYNSAIIKIIISVITYAVAVAILKGV